MAHFFSRRPEQLRRNLCMFVKKIILPRYFHLTFSLKLQTFCFICCLGMKFSFVKFRHLLYSVWPFQLRFGKIQTKSDITRKFFSSKHNYLTIFLFFDFQVDFFNKDLERFERKVTTPELLQNEKQIKEDLEFLNSLREESLRRKFESQVTAATTKEQN